MHKKNPTCRSCGPDGVYRDAAGEKQVCPCWELYAACAKQVALAFAAVQIGHQLTFAALESS